MIENGTGLRDRKRRETRARIEDAAVALVLRDGLETTTVGAISELADVSPRTFFNYFESKDAAILGLGAVDLDDHTVEEILRDHHDDDVVGALVHLLLMVMAPPSSRPDIRGDRMEIIRRHPEVLGGQVERMTQMSGHLTEVVARVLAEHGSRGGGAVDPSTAPVVLAACAGAIKTAVKEWADTERDPVPELVGNRAAQLVRDMVERLR